MANRIKESTLLWSIFHPLVIQWISVRLHKIVTDIPLPFVYGTIYIKSLQKYWAASALAETARKKQRPQALKATGFRKAKPTKRSGIERAPVYLRNVIDQEGENECKEDLEL